MSIQNDIHKFISTQKQLGYNMFDVELMDGEVYHGVGISLGHESVTLTMHAHNNILIQSSAIKMVRRYDP